MTKTSNQKYGGIPTQMLACTFIFWVTDPRRNSCHFAVGNDGWYCAAYVVPGNWLIKFAGSVGGTYNAWLDFREIHHHILVRCFPYLKSRDGVQY